MNLTDKEILKSIEKYGSARKAAKALNIPKSTFSDAVRRVRSQKLVEQKVIKPLIIKAPRGKGVVKRYILSSAQNGTLVHPFFHHLKIYAEYLGAELLISGYTYNKALFEDHAKQNAEFAPELLPYLTSERVQLGDKIVFAGEVNILPTASNPISGLTTYTKEKIGIIPHARIHLTSVPMMKGEPVKMVLTTGTVTRPNYIQKLAGSKAEFHHTQGAVIVELCANGDIFYRHVMGEDKTGEFYDLDRHVTLNGVTQGHRVEAINWGDVHESKLDPVCASSSFGYDVVRKTFNVTEGTLLDRLKPYNQFYHDTLDFSPRNHHQINNPYHRFKTFIQGEESVSKEIENASNFLNGVYRDWCNTYVVESNHDAAINRWLANTDYKLDPVNAIFFLEMQLEKYKAIRDNNYSYNSFWSAISKHLTKDVKFIPEDTSFKILDIEMGMHGHLGANGAKPSPQSFSKVGTKSNTGHTHSASIIDGVWTAGVSGRLEMGYNKGLSSWSHTHIVTYRNGKRAMLTMSPSGKFYAE